MRAHTFLLASLLVVGQILSLTLASPLPADGMNKRVCIKYNCRLDDAPPPIAVGTWTPSPYQPSETATAASTPTPVNQQLGADSTQSTGSVLEPSSAFPSGTKSSSANAGVALASHGSGLGLGIALTGLLATVLVF